MGRKKIEKEQLIKAKALVLAETQAYLNKQTEIDNGIANDITNLHLSLDEIREKRSELLIDLEIQLVLKQGIVEVDSKAFNEENTDSVLINRSVVEDLNSKIRQF